jgi:pimeloyl-ACP methyl ester carboxylesterase
MTQLFRQVQTRRSTVTFDSAQLPWIGLVLSRRSAPGGHGSAVDVDASLPMSLQAEIVGLPTGAEMRLTGDGTVAIVCVNGGQAAEVEGTWSASLEWLVGRLAPRFRHLLFAEVRYRVKSWRRLEACVEDARAAVDALGADRALLLGYSMGGAVAISAADRPAVERVLGLAPWIPDSLSLEPLRGKRLDVLHGSLDRRLPGVPGVSPASSRRGFERARGLEAAGRYELIPGALHGIALRAHRGRPVPLPRAAAWERCVAAQLAAL